MNNCPVSGLPVLEYPHWKANHAKSGYMTHFSLIGSDIIHGKIVTDREVRMDFIDLMVFKSVIKECNLVGNAIQMLFGLENVKDISYATKRDLVNLLYNMGPNFKILVLYGIDPEIRPFAETLALIAPVESTIVMTEDYAESLQVILDHKLQEPHPASPESIDEPLEETCRKDFLSALGRMNWLNILDHRITMPDSNSQFYPYFKALEGYQRDLQEKENLRNSEENEVREQYEKKLAEKIILLNAQRELNNRLKAQFDTEKAALRSRIMAQEMEIHRISMAIAEKTAVLKSLSETISGLDIDEKAKAEMLNSCSKMIETETLEKMVNTDLSSTDSEFISKLQRKHPNLNQRDLRICLLIKLNHDTREIARSIGITTRGLESIRYRMHKKMRLSKHQSIKNYLSNLALS